MLICSVPSIRLAKRAQAEPHNTQKHTKTSHFFLLDCPFCVCMWEAKQEHLFLSSTHFFLSLVVKHVLFSEHISASPVLHTQSSLSLLSSLPISVLFIRSGHAFLINHFYSLIYLFCGLSFPLRNPVLNLMQSACLAHKWKRETEM